MGKLELLASHLKALYRLLSMVPNKKGQTLVEYGLILALVSIVVISVLGLMGNRIKIIFNTITSTLSTAS